MFYVTASNSTCPRNQFLKALTNRKVNFNTWGSGDSPIIGATNYGCCSFKNANSSSCIKVSSPIATPFYQGTPVLSYAPLYNNLKCPNNYFVTSAVGSITFKRAPKASFTGVFPYIEVTCCKPFL